MKYHSLQKNLSSTSKHSMKDSNQPPWISIIKPVDEPMPQHSFQCECEMCNVYQYRKVRETLKYQTAEMSAKIQTRITTSNAVRLQRVQSNYHWIIKHLMMPNHKIATSTLPIHITESLFFKDGQANQLFLVKEIEDPVFKRIPKDKLSNPYVQKVMSDRRRKYKDYIRTKTGRKKAEQKKKLLFGQKQVKKQIKDAVLIRYIDGYEQLLTENQFLSMSLRRKQDPIWRQVMSIRNFINITNPEQKGSSYVVAKFKRDRIEDIDLYERARLLMRVYGQYIREGDQKYISPASQMQFRKELQATSLKKHSDYLVYQIVNYIEYFYDQQIQTAVIGIYYDELGHPFLNQVYKLDIKSLIKFVWTNDAYRKRMDDEETKILNSKKVVSDSTIEKGADGIISAMHLAYEKMRDRMGLNAVDEDDKEQVANNAFFKILHPQFHHNVTDLLKNPNMTVSEFKKSYLGFRLQKKPVIKEFTSNMIKTIHLTSPRFQTSNPHDFIDSNSKYNSPRFPQSERKKGGTLSPLKLDSRRKLYQTLPLRNTK